jgi:hypothetical protein
MMKTPPMIDITHEIDAFGSSTYGKGMIIDVVGLLFLFDVDVQLIIDRRGSAQARQTEFASSHTQHTQDWTICGNL